MFEHDGGHTRQYDRANNGFECDSFLFPKFQPRPYEPRDLEQLPWLRNLFGDLASIEELMAENSVVV